MTNFYNNNDDSLRKKLTEHEFDLVPKAWDQMAQLLDQQAVPPKRVGGYWWSVSVLVIAALSGVVSVGMYLRPDSVAEAPNIKAVQKAAVQPASLNSSNRQFKSLESISAPAKSQSNPATQPTQVAPKTLDVTPAPTSPASKKAANTTVGPLASANTPTVQKEEPSTTSTPKKAANEINTTSDLDQNQGMIDMIENPEVGTTDANTTIATPSKYPVKKTRVEVIHQYSTTPLRALQERRKLAEQRNTPVGDFGIGTSLNTKQSPIKASVFGGTAIKQFKHSNALSILPTAGVAATYRLAKQHSIQAGLQYKNTSILHHPINLINPEPTASQAFMDSPFSTVERLDMLELPLVYQFHPHAKVRLQAGVKGTWIFNADLGENIGQVNPTDLGMNNLDLGVLIGMEYCFNKHWSVAVQYNLGLFNLLNKQAVTYVTEDITRYYMNAGLDHNAVREHTTNTKEMLVPYASSLESGQQLIRLPSELNNNDLQILVRYTF